MSTATLSNINMCFKKILCEVNQIGRKDNEFLDEFVRAFYLLNSAKTAAVKKISGEYIAATANYVNLVGYQAVEEIINTTDDNLPSSLAKLSTLYAKQDLLVGKYHKTLSFLEIHEFSTGLGIFIFHRSPVINPFTNQTVAIEINIEPLQTRGMLETIFSIHRYKVIDERSSLIFNSNIKLGEKQLEILFCLLIGFKEDKGIAKFLEYVKKVEYNVENIKSSIRDLFRKFNVRTRDQLIESAILYKTHTLIPKSFLRTGSFPLKDTTAIIRN